MLWNAEEIEGSILTTRLQNCWKVASQPRYARIGLERRAYQVALGIFGVSEERAGCVEHKVSTLDYAVETALLQQVSFVQLEVAGKSVA